MAEIVGDTIIGEIVSKKGDAAKSVVLDFFGVGDNFPFPNNIHCIGHCIDFAAMLVGKTDEEKQALIDELNKLPDVKKN